MKTKEANRLFLISLIVEAAVVILLMVTEISMSPIVSLILNQLILLLPALVFLAVTKTGPGFISHNRIHPVTPLMCILYTGFCMPLITVVNMISTLFVDNTANQIMGLLAGVPGWLIVLVVGILGPINEEFLYRGIFYHSYKGTGRVLAAMFMSSFLFGLMHLNFNQMSYAIVVGIMAVLLIEATGNIASSMIFHGCINTYNAVLMLIQQKQMAGTGKDAQDVMDESLAALGVNYQQFVLIAIAVLGCIALVTTALAGLLLYGMVIIENRQKEFFGIFKKRQRETMGEKKQSLWTVSLAVAVILSLLYMIVELVIPVITG